ncbi:cerebellar degeneration-related protein 2-like isoform X2 [Lycorma delicatula]|uniref:cerebellar degeneration-related protein 2-like isoform X2 n=1 Tax=Lycorma delicatula TaxID=130591 RepID=UPI003F519F48
MNKTDPDTGLESAPNSLECWDYSVELECLRGSEDLQLAAELGKTLLERNKELETSLRQHQNVIEDQTQEIEYLTKQTAALREVNDSRLRIYEQLEVSIQELERANQRLAIESTNDKKHIKSLTGQVDTLELRCEELQKNLDELTVALEAARRRQRRSVCTPDEPESPALPKNNPPQSSHTPLPLFSQPEFEDEMTQLLQQLQEARTQKTREQRKVQDLAEQLAVVLQENASLEERLSLLHQKEEDMKSLQEELSMLEEIRQGHLCRRCLRGADERSLMAEEEDEELSVIDSLVDETQRNSVLMQLQESLGDSCQGDNPYRVLVEKYEALLKVQRHPGIIRPPQTVSSNNCLSLQEELQLSGDFSSFNKEEEDVDSEGEIRELPRKEPVKTTTNGTKAFSATPTDFSETETSSSGFSDETSNKCTQTDAHFPPGSFLCTISDGDDCRFSIYDDASPVESRFRKTPEYRQLFREIFAVLKRAAEAKDEGEKLPLLDDYTPVCEDAPKVPPVTPAKEDAPNVPDSEDSVEVSLLSETNSEELSGDVNGDKVATTTALSPQDIGQMNKESQNTLTTSETTSLTAQDSEMDKKKPTKDILEYISSGVGNKKKSGAKKHSTPKPSSTSSDSPTLLGINAKVSYSSKVTRRKKESSRLSSSDGPNKVLPDRSTWCVSGVNIIPQSGKDNLTNGLDGARPESQLQRHSVWDVQPFTSSASHEVAKLKMLEKSYAEVLRLGRQKNSNRNSNHHHHRK